MSFTLISQAQITSLTPDHKVFNADSLLEDFDRHPYFGIYKDNYFIAGTAIGTRPTQYNSDVKFQLSISQRLTRSTLPGRTYLFLYFTQKTLWNVFEESLPVRDMNFNPGIGLSKYIIKNNRLVGKATLLLEHESNGRDGEASRSWNKVSLCGSVFLDQSLMLHGKIWVPIVDGENNKDILKYCGMFQVGLQVLTTNKRWAFDVNYVKRKGWNLSGNITINIGFRLSRRFNQYLMLQYYNGYGECLLDYNKFHSRLRMGLLIRPTIFSDF